jgi:hypothetical protein
MQKKPRWNCLILFMLMNPLFISPLFIFWVVWKHLELGYVEWSFFDLVKMHFYECNLFCMEVGIM